MSKQLRAAADKLLTRFLTWENTPAGRRWTMVVLIYVLTTLERKGWLPALPIPRS